MGQALERELPSVPVLYEDNHVIVVEKPPNMPTQADDSGDPDLLNWLKNDLKSRYGKPGNVFVGLVHRLDRPVGGVMVFAKTSKAASRLSEQVRTRAMSKTYRAFVHGIPADAARLRHFLRKDAKTNTVTAFKEAASEAKEAILDYRVVKSFPAEVLSLVEVDLLTGRPHQIRVQFAAVGHPLYGDQKYGANVTRPGQQIALWAVKLAFEHPTLRQPMSFESAAPSAYPWSLHT